MTGLDPRPQHLDPVPLSRVAGLLGVATAQASQDADPMVHGVSLSSRAVRPGDLYAALPGSRTHGARFADEAAVAGVAAFLTDRDGAEDCARTGLPVLVVERPRASLGAVSALVYGQPAEALTTLGVTGTQGKTTTTHLMDGALRAAGRRSAVVGTIGTRIDGQPVASLLTTPEAPDLHALFAVMRERGTEMCSMEVSSHALVQGRVDGVVFDVAVFLNLGRDHLDFHADMEDYFAAKAGLFTPERASRAVVDVDDEYGRRLAETTSLPLTTVGRDGDWRVSDIVSSGQGSRFVLSSPDHARHEVEVPLPGTFNVANAAAGLVGLAVAGVPVEQAIAGLAAAPGVPGRMERVQAGQGFTAVVDYAHKPDAVTAVLEALRPTVRGRLIVVIGAGGERDAGKRPVMGEAAARSADVIVVTDDNPRDEDPAAIRRELLVGARSGTAEVVEIGDRRAAIGHAVELAGPDDCVVVAGKGHESGQEVGGVVHPFDDSAVLAAEIERVLG